MDRQQLIELKDEGYTYLIRKIGDDRYTPFRGDLNEIKALSSEIPFSEDGLLSIEDAIEFCGQVECQPITVRLP